MGPGGTDEHFERCGTERISVVSYFRTKMTGCDSLEEETAKAAAYAEKRAMMAEKSVVTEMAEEAMP